MKNYYKVTTEINNRQLSYATFHGEAEVKYQKNLWVEAPIWLAEKGYHLFVFNNMENAKKFVGDPSSSTCIWECEVKGKFKHLPIRLSRPYLDYGELLALPYDKFPKGTIMVKKVKLLKLIED